MNNAKSSTVKPNATTLSSCRVDRKKTAKRREKVSGEKIKKKKMLTWPKVAGR
jgi:hypothetical protein